MNFEEHKKRFQNGWSQLCHNPPEGFSISQTFIKGDYVAHPQDHFDYQFSFFVNYVNKLKPENILDVGSYRWFIIGLLGHYNVTSVDVRSRKPLCDNETVLNCDASKLKLSNNSFDMVISTMCIEHIGLGRYGDEVDLKGDAKAFNEMIRVTRPGGHILFSVSMTRDKPQIIFNAHRIYSHEMIRKLCANLELVEERFLLSGKSPAFVKLEQIPSVPKRWDVYCGCWRKPK